MQEKRDKILANGKRNGKKKYRKKKPLTQPQHTVNRIAPNHKTTTNRSETEKHTRKPNDQEKERDQTKTHTHTHIK